MSVIQAPAHTTSFELRGEKTVRPVVWWAALGTGVLGLWVYLAARWFTSGNMTKTHPGPDEVPYYMKVSIVAWSALAIALTLVGVYVWVIKPKREGRPIPLDGLLFFSAYTLYWWDPWGNLWQPWYTYNSWATNWGSWANFVPGYTVPRGQFFAEPVLFIFFIYGTFLFLPTIFFCWLMRKAKERWPGISTMGLLGVAFFSGLIVDLGFEIPWMVLGIYTYPGIPKTFTLFHGHYYQFPLVEAFLVSIAWTAMSAVRYFRNDKGQTIVERGIERLKIGTRATQMVRFLAFSGLYTAAWGLLYLMPWIFIVMSTTPTWPDDIVNRSYFTTQLCGPQTPIACPNSKNPIPRPGSGYVGPDGVYVPAAP